VQAIIGILFALISALIWGTTTILARVFLRNQGGITLNAVRLLIAAPFYLVILLYTGFPHIDNLTLFIIALSSLSGFVLGDYFFFTSMKFMGVSRSMLITSIYPVWVIIFGFLLLGREITPMMVLGALLIAAAVGMVMYKRENIEFNYIGVLNAIVAQFLWALAVLSIDWLLEGMPVLKVTAMRVSMGGLIALFILPWERKKIAVLTAKEWFFAAIIAIFGIVIAQYTFTTAINLAGPGIASPLGETSPILASIFAKVFLHEKVTSRLFLAITLTIAGVAVLMM